MDKSVIDQIVTGLVEPRIYAFLTHDVPRYLKVGDTYRPVRVRIAEWRKKGFDIRDDAYRSWSALLDEGVFFRDYAVHEYLTCTAGMARITEAQLRKLPRADEDGKGKDAPYSREFFRYADDSQPESTVVAAVSGSVDAAIGDITKFHAGKGGSKQAYTIYDVKGMASGLPPAGITKIPYGLQKKAIAKFLNATNPANMPRKGKKLLMYAVMRFGKTFTSLCCAKEMQIDATHKGARLVVVVSAKKDVGGEWKDEVRNTKNFAAYEFLDANNLKKNDSVLRQINSRSKKFVVFLTLQSFLRKKAWLEQLFKSKIDLLIVDETHFAARAEKMGKVLAEEPKEQKGDRADVDRDDDAGETIKAEDEDAAVKALSLKARVRLHLSGTPYRILMRGEFPEEDIVAFCQYTDIIDAQTKWDRNYLGKIDAKSGREYAEWDNPYYGFPQMVRFAFNPNPAAQEMIRRVRENGETCSFTEIFKPAVDDQDAFTGKFVHEKEVTEFLRVFNGSDEGEQTGFIALFKYLKDRKINLCNHVVMVLPYCASCDAMEKLLKSGKYDLLGEYEILNISGHKRPKAFDDPSTVKNHIKKCAAANPPKKTLTLTVNRMLTGSTVPAWDTMIFLKETKSPQEYDQAIFRLQSPYVLTIPGRNPETGAEETIRRNMKPQTLLVDFNPGRMFRMQEFKGQVYNNNVGKKGHEELQKRIQKELEVSPIIFCNADKLKQAEYVDVVNEVRAYTGTRGVSEEVQEIAVDVDDIFKDKALYTLISNENLLDASSGLTIKATKGEGEEFSPTDTKRPETKKIAGEIRQESEDEKKRAEMASRFRNYMRRVLFYVFLIAKDGKPETKVETLNEVIATVKGAENLRIAKNIRINRKDLMNLKKINSKVLDQFEYSISRISELAHDPKKIDPLDRALTAIRKFGRIGDAEIITPQKIARQMVDQIPDKEWKKMIMGGEKILDPASKIGEFAIAVTRKLNQDCELPIKSFRSSICAIATSGISYEFTRKVYELLGLDTSCVADPDLLTSYKLLNVKTGGRIDYEKIARILKQRKPFNTISINDTVGKRVRKMNTFGTVIGNPPYQLETATKKSETNGQAPRVSIFQYVQNVSDSVTGRYTLLIYPGKRWLHRSGKGMEEFGLRQINDVHLSHVDYFAPKEPVFNVVEIADGITIVLKDACKDSHSFGYAYHENGLTDECVLTSPGSSLLPLNPRDGRVVDKAIRYCVSANKSYLSERLLPRSLFGIESEFVELNPTKVRPYEKGTRIDLDAEIKLFTNDRAGKAGRAKWFVAKRDVIKVNQQHIDEWQVVVSSANAGGQKRDWQIELIDNHSAFGRSRVGLGSFKTRREAENFYKYCTSYLIRFLFLMTDESLTSLAKQVPDIQDYTDGNGLIDFHGDVNRQLYRLFGLTDAEVAYVEKTIKDIDSSRSRKGNDEDAE